MHRGWSDIRLLPLLPSLTSCIFYMAPAWQYPSQAWRRTLNLPHHFIPSTYHISYSGKLAVGTYDQGLHHYHHCECILQTRRFQLL
ncbi:hypothetical protein B0H11DRAFT_2128187 [Mycena galericulata]|nr:hypothetical protein B0H11DRAFT_2128187 [Mycena galericulata]